MGCNFSKLDELEALALCRNRCDLLAEAIRHRYALADAHAAYGDSLRSVGVALHRVLDGGHEVHPGSSPVLPLPGKRKGDPVHPPSLSRVKAPAPVPQQAAAAIPMAQSHSRSHSGSHINFHSDDSDSDDISPLHSDGDSPVHLHPDYDVKQGGGPVNFNLHYAKNNPPPPSILMEQRVKSPDQVKYGFVSEPSSSSFFPYGHHHTAQYYNSSAHLHPDNSEIYGGVPVNVNHHHARKNPPPSVSFEQPLESPEQVKYGSVSEPSSSSFFPYGHQYTNQNSNLHPQSFSYVYPPNYYGLFGSSSPPPAMSQPAPAGAGANSKTISSPQKTSTWDFLNPFEAFENYYPHYASSRSSKEVREDEGIPELEEDEQEVIKEAYGDQKFVASTSAGAVQEHSNKDAPAEKDEIVDNGVESTSYHGTPKEDEEIVEKSVVSDKLQRSQEVPRSVAVTRKYHSVSEVASEIRVQYERAAESTKELSRMLEVGKHPYSRKGSICAGSSRMLCALPVSLSKDAELVYVEDKVMRTGNISSTLQKLYIWELKLLNEVRVEEKMRVFHERKSKKLQRLDERGAESHKIDATQKLLRKLETKIMIAIQIVNSISIKINVLRDEELWPEIDELIQGLERMWKAMLECHQIQCQAIASEAAHLAAISSGGIRLSDSHVNAVMQLELELLRWIGNFAAWTNSHKNFVKSLNSWLVLCLHYEPEVTADGIPPYSPGRIGAPPAFVVFNSWSQALDRISESEVLDAMQAFASSVKHLWRPNDMELQQKMTANKDIEKLHKIRERETKVIHRELEALNRKLIVNSTHDDLQSALRRAFESIESFSESLVKAYGDIRARAEEEAKHSQS